VKKFKFGIVGSIASLILVGGLSASIVQAAAPETKIYACVTGINGNIIRVKMTPHTCPARTTPIEWSVSGAQGIQGVRGEAGPRGEMGIQGPAGLEGKQGIAGPKGIQGATGDTGPQGPEGIEGKQGIAGPQGIQGAKGDPGYSYEEALASVDDETSKVQSVSFGSGGCVGAGFKLYSAYGNQFICAKTFHELSTLNILSVRTAPSNGAKPDARAIYVAPVECPNSMDGLSSYMTTQNLKGFLVDNASPFRISNASSVSCVFMFIHVGYQAQSGMYQVVYSAN
jgi:hypothetical protein